MPERLHRVASISGLGVIDSGEVLEGMSYEWRLIYTLFLKSQRLASLWMRGYGRSVQKRPDRVVAEQIKRMPPVDGAGARLPSRPGQTGSRTCARPSARARRPPATRRVITSNHGASSCETSTSPSCSGTECWTNRTRFRWASGSPPSCPSADRSTWRASARSDSSNTPSQSSNALFSERPRVRHTVAPVEAAPVDEEADIFTGLLDVLPEPLAGE